MTNVVVVPVIGLLFGTNRLAEYAFGGSDPGAWRVRAMQAGLLFVPAIGVLLAEMRGFPLLWWPLEVFSFLVLLDCLIGAMFFFVGIWHPGVARVRFFRTPSPGLVAGVLCLWCGCVFWLNYRQGAPIDISGPLISELKDGVGSVRYRAANALGRARSQRAVEPLIAALKDKDPRMRFAAMGSLGEIQDPRAADPLIAMLKESPDSDVRAMAARALGRIHDQRATKALVGALNTDPELREVAVASLGRGQDARAVEALIAALKDPGFRVRSCAAQALGESGDPRAVEPLIVAMKTDPEFRVQESAARALGGTHDVRATEPLIAALKGSDSRMRFVAAGMLGESKDPRVVTPLIAALRSPGAINVHVRARSAEALGKIGDHGAIAPLSNALQEDEEFLVKLTAAQALQAMNDPRAAEPLKALLIGQMPNGPIALRAVTNDDGTMTYDKKELKVTMGQEVTIVFTNPDTALHNFLLGTPGSLKIIGAAADKMVRNDTGEEVSFVPKLPQILFAEARLEPRRTTRFVFKAPATPGEYVIVCTFPGHWKTMNSVLNVVNGVKAK